MKTKFITNASKLFLVTLVAGLFAGCAATRPIGDVAFGAGGAYLGHELSNGDPLITAAAAAGGVIVSETLHYAAGKQSIYSDRQKRLLSDVKQILIDLLPDVRDIRFLWSKTPCCISMRIATNYAPGW